MKHSSTINVTRQPIVEVGRCQACTRPHETVIHIEVVRGETGVDTILRLCDACAPLMAHRVDHVDQLDVVDDGLASAGSVRQRITAFLKARPGRTPARIAEGIGAKPHTVRARLHAMAKAKIVTVGDDATYTLTNRQPELF